jgi:hypothetical protein
MSLNNDGAWWSFTVVLGLIALASGAVGSEPASPASASTDRTNAEISALRAEVNRLKGIVPDQSHAMKDVGYHFANLWFAGQKQNWPLAKFYLDETRSHLKWAVRIIPVRKTKAGDVDLEGIREALDKSLLAKIHQAIEAKNLAAFTDAYKLSMTGCYSCHKASEKPFLRPQIPSQPGAPIINFDPNAKWPE